MVSPRGAAQGRKCDFEGTMELLGQRHVLMILYSLYERSPRRFNELGKTVRVNTATLSDRLKRLETLGIVNRNVIHALPRRVEYGITPMGKDLLKIFRTMMEWKQKYAGLPPHRAKRARDV